MPVWLNYLIGAGILILALRIIFKFFCNSKKGEGGCHTGCSGSCAACALAAERMKAKKNGTI